MKNKKLLTLAILLGAATTNIATAKETYDNRLYIAPSLSYMRLDADRLSAKNGYGAALGLGKAIDQNINLEAKVLYNHYGEGRSNEQWNNLGATADLQYYFSREKIAPYAVIGAGAMQSFTDGKTALGFIAETGFGLAYKMNDNLTLRGDVRYRYNQNFNSKLSTNNSAYNDAVVNLGIVIPFGASVVESIKAVSFDNQPSDNTFTTAQIMGFAVNSSKLNSSNQESLDEIAQKVIADKRDSVIEANGHASSEGSSASNMTLSQKRAKSVAAYLKSKGVSKKIITKGFGEDKPIADNATEEGRQKNRRVELIIK